MAQANAINSPLTGFTGTGNYVGATNPAITTPRIGQINDPTFNLSVLTFTAAAAAVNRFSMFASDTTNNVILSALGSDTNIIMALIGKGNGGVAVQGQKSGVSFNSGYVGEILSTTVTSVSGTAYTSGATVNIVSINLPAGNWDLMGNIGVSGTTVSATVAGISAVNAVLPAQELTSYIFPAAGSANVRVPVPMISVNLSVLTTYFLVMQSSGTGSMTMYGRLLARRRC